MEFSNLSSCRPFYHRVDLSGSDIIDMTSPISLLPNIDLNQFYDIHRIIWKLKFISSPYDYTGEIFFKIGQERISTLQADSLNSNRSSAAVSNANVCKDFKCPFVELGETLKMEMSGTPPTTGDSEITIEIHYYIEEI